MSNERRGKRYVIGIDEVGRGALAGPVVVVAAAIPRTFSAKRAFGLGVPSRLKDSKKLSAKQREAWYTHFLDYPDIFFAAARVYPRGIERLNISAAANLAALRAFKRLKVDGSIFLDGGLFLGNGRQKKENQYRAKTIVKGDEKITAIKVASIVAKVHRDRFMKKLAKRYPQYGFEIHKGYGTKLHRAAIQKNGPSLLHRTTFLSNIVV